MYQWRFSLEGEIYDRRKKVVEEPEENLGHFQVILQFLQNKSAKLFKVSIPKKNMNNSHNNLKWKKNLSQ